MPEALLNQACKQGKEEPGGGSAWNEAVHETSKNSSGSAKECQLQDECEATHLELLTTGLLTNGLPASLTPLHRTVMIFLRGGAVW